MATDRSRQAAKKRWWAVHPACANSVPIGIWRAYAEVVAVVAVFFAASIVAAAFSLANHPPYATVHGWTQAVPASMSQIVTAVLSVAVPVLLVRRRGLTCSDLGLRRSSAIYGSQIIRIFAWALLALVIGGAVTAALATGNVPKGPFSYPSLTLNLFHAAQAGPLEETVVLAFVVVTLEQARRPQSEIVVVALVMRSSYHIYYGPGVLGIMIWASAFLWLYLRFRSIVPLIVVHSTWDVVITLEGHWRVVGGVAGLVFVAIGLSAVITWLRWRSQRTDPGDEWSEAEFPVTGLG